MGGNSTVYDAFGLQSLESENTGEWPSLLACYLGVASPIENPRFHVLCHREDESVFNVLCDCPRTMLVWSKLLSLRMVTEFMSLPLKEWVLTSINYRGSYSCGDAEWSVRFVGLWPTFLLSLQSVISSRKWFIILDDQQMVVYIRRSANCVANSSVRLCRGAPIDIVTFAEPPANVEVTMLKDYYSL
ncbi:hypothetical protein V6N11_050113 [Hibiscus sabdariffa]|uniref:Uncharacterized protein n=1 Tax=Hibiscus sabdariffa TaxID=183260 RepID=A0ABR2T8V5_9ROSI